MKTGSRLRFDVGRLRDLAGAKVFARGESYYQDGLVRILAIERHRVLAQVAGTEDYRTELTKRGATIGGECSCPAFGDWGFCKHLVATALAANAAAADAKTDGGGALVRIRSFLKEKSIDALVAMIIEQAERDSALLRKLEMAAAAASADDKTLEASLRQAIDQATRTRGFVDYGEASGWAAGVNAVLDSLAAVASSERPGLALNLAGHAISRIERAIENIDDSDGHCGGLLDRVRDIHLAACRNAAPDPKKLAGDLFAREMQDEYNTFSGAAALYADILGPQGLAEYRHLAAAAWEKLPARRAARDGDDDAADYFRLASILDFFAERDGDVAARIAIRAKDLSSQWSYLELAQFCRAQGREDEALRHAEEGLWMFEDDRPDGRLVVLAVELLLKAHRKADAETHLWRAFAGAPSLELYGRLRALGGEAARDRALKFLESRLAKPPHSWWLNPADLLIGILMREELFEAAWAATRTYSASANIKQALAKASEKTHRREAIAVYCERVEKLAKTGGNPAYAEAVELIARVAALCSAAEQAAYLADLKERHGRKRNFMKLLGAGRETRRD